MSAALLLPQSFDVGMRTGVVAASVVTVAGARGARWLLAASVGVTAGAAATAMHGAALHAGPIARLAPGRPTVDVQLKLMRDPVSVRSRSGRRLVVADATVSAVRRPRDAWSSDRAPIVVFAIDSQWLGVLPGQRLTAPRRPAPPKPRGAVAPVPV